MLRGGQFSPEYGGGAISVAKAKGQEQAAGGALGPRAEPGARSPQTFRELGRPCEVPWTEQVLRDGSNVRAGSGGWGWGL